MFFAFVIVLSNWVIKVQAADLLLGRVISGQTAEDIGNYIPGTLDMINSPVVKTKNGKVTGNTMISREGKAFYFYGGLPYAKPPIGDLRFEPPVEFSGKWNGTRDASSFAQPCAQHDVIITQMTLGKEDCLYLNVATPDVKPKSLKPVLVFFHGGAFQFGRANEYGGRYLIDEDIVLVTPSYRLGALGFLNTGDSIARGNMGLKDQTMALRWIQKNIKYFGGDPNRVTISGQSAGSASTHLHVLSPLSKGLFTKAIAFSGSALALWAVNKNATNSSEILKERVGCTKFKGQDLAKCLKRADYRKIVEFKIENVEQEFSLDRLFLPTVETILSEDTFLSQHPNEILASGNFNHVPLMIGTVLYDGNIFAARLEAHQVSKKEMVRILYEILPKLLGYDPANKNITDDIYKHYLPPNVADITDDFTPFVKLASDYIFNYPLAITTEQHKKHAPTFVYHYTYPDGLTVYDFVKAVKNERAGTLLGSVSAVQQIVRDRTTLAAQNQLQFKILDDGKWKPGHADEMLLIFYFGIPILDIPKGDHQYPMSRNLTKMIGDFVKADKKELENQKFGHVHWRHQQDSTDDHIPTMVINNDPYLQETSPYDEGTKLFKKLGLKGN